MFDNFVQMDLHDCIATGGSAGVKGYIPTVMVANRSYDKFVPVYRTGGENF